MYVRLEWNNSDDDGDNDGVAGQLAMHSLFIFMYSYSVYIHLIHTRNICIVQVEWLIIDGSHTLQLTGTAEWKHERTLRQP